MVVSLEQSVKAFVNTFLNYNKGPSTDTRSPTSSESSQKDQLTRDRSPVRQMLTTKIQERIKNSKQTNHPLTQDAVVPRSSSERSPVCLNNKLSFLVKLSDAFSPSQPHSPFLLYLCYPRTALLSKALTCKLCLWFYVLETSVKSRAQHKHFFEWFSLFRVNVQMSRFPPAMLYYHPDSSLMKTK